MTPDLDPAMIRASWQRIAQAGDMVPLRFYETLFYVHPELRSKFPKRMSRQRDHLVKAIDHVVRSVDHLEQVLPELKALGRRHARLAAPEHYAYVGQALIATFRQTDPLWDVDLRAQWEAAYALVAQVMSQAAAELHDEMDPTPRWYHVARNERLGSWEAMVWLDAADQPVDPKSSCVWVTPDGQPGWWQDHRPLTVGALADVDADPRRLDTRDLIVLYVTVNDHASRALAVSPIGARVAVAPMEDNQ